MVGHCDVYPRACLKTGIPRVSDFDDENVLNGIALTLSIEAWERRRYTGREVDTPAEVSFIDCLGLMVHKQERSEP